MKENVRILWINFCRCGIFYEKLLFVIYEFVDYIYVVVFILIEWFFKNIFFLDFFIVDIYKRIIEVFEIFDNENNKIVDVRYV